MRTSPATTTPAPAPATTSPCRPAPARRARARARPPRRPPAPTVAASASHVPACDRCALCPPATKRDALGPRRRVPAQDPTTPRPSARSPRAAAPRSVREPPWFQDDAPIRSPGSNSAKPWTIAATDRSIALARRHQHDPLGAAASPPVSVDASSHPPTPRQAPSRLDDTSPRPPTRGAPRRDQLRSAQERVELRPASRTQPVVAGSISPGRA